MGALAWGLIVMVCVSVYTQPALTKPDPQIKKQFDDYYKCITENLKTGQTQAEALLLQAGQSIKLQCHLCMRPDQDVEQYNIKWRRSLLQAAGEEAIDVDGDHFMLTPVKDLIIRKATLADAGRYTCYKYQGAKAVYQLDVVRSERRRQVVQAGIKGLPPLPPSLLTKYNLQALTVWASWGPCNRCGARGEKYCHGLCTVKKIRMNSPVLPRDVKAFSQYKNGIPCRSAVLPTKIARIPEIYKRPSETLTGLCYEPCPTQPAIKNITDAAGNVIEVVKSAEGYQSMREGLPSLPPIVKRRTFYEKQGKSIILECPHKKSDIQAIRWQKGSQVINIMTIRRKTRGRIKVDISNRLHLRKLRYSDTAAYSCWIKGVHIATIRVRVVPNADHSFKDYIILVGLGLCVLTVSAIGCSACRSKNKGRAR